MGVVLSGGEDEEAWFWWEEKMRGCGFGGRRG